MSHRFLNDEQLLAECHIDISRGSGPGGQKRNKTSNAVHLRHLATGIEATGTESRSLAENRLHAVHRLRLKIAAEVREPIDLLSFVPPDWFVSIRREKRIEASSHNPCFAPAAGLVLDLLAAVGANPASVAVNLGVTTTAIIKLLEKESVLWTAANRMRAARGMPGLTHRR